jgi:DNA-binding response OmpR family regulator
MKIRPPGFDGRHIVVADEDRAVAGFVIETLRCDGHAVFHAYDGLSATELATALKICDLVISNTKFEGEAGIDLIHQLRKLMPALPILYLANNGRSTPEIERELPPDVPILREPFTAEELRTHVAVLLDGKGDGKRPAK